MKQVFHHFRLVHGRCIVVMIMVVAVLVDGGGCCRGRGFGLDSGCGHDRGHCFGCGRLGRRRSLCRPLLWSFSLLLQQYIENRTITSFREQFLPMFFVLLSPFIRAHFYSKES